ncbi:AI-2E family transporter [Methylopila musalis]|uniref:AI-2E family transporter n=1 Tax=Methylopila musalis TaxID=1134781 RepID=A0ABW3Z7N4_9HYPH
MSIVDENGPLDITAGPTPLKVTAPARAPISSMLDSGAKVACIGLFVIVLSAALKLAAEILVPMTLAIIIGLLLGPGIGRLEKRGLSSTASALLVVLTLFGLVYLAAYAFSMPLQSWIDRAPELWAALQRRVLEMRSTFLQIKQVTESLERVTSMGDDSTPRVLVQGAGLLSSAALSAPALIGQAALFACTLFFYLATRSSIRTGLLSMCLGRKAQLTAGRIMRDVEARVSDYLVTITVINVALGVATALAMWMIGMPSPALWGALAFALNYAPFLGPAALTVILVGVSLVTFKTALAIMAPPLAFVALTFIEGNILTPMILGRRFTINPLLVLGALAFWLWLWGPVGAFLAAPLLVIALVLAKHLILPHVARREEKERSSARRVRRRARKERRMGAPVTAAARPAPAPAE